MSSFRNTCIIAMMLLAHIVLADEVPISTEDMMPSTDPTCQGKWIDPVTDICWSCMFPIKIGGATVADSNQEDTDNPPDVVCSCGTDLLKRFGIQLSFWEPVRRVEAVRRPYCMTSLGGIVADPGIEAPAASRHRKDYQGASSFYQVHWYADPIAFWLGIIIDHRCMEQSVFDIAYMTELDPLWNDDELTTLLYPEAILFANPVAQASCAGDCISATATFPISNFFWCAGCYGSLYPTNGNINAHIGGVQASSLLVSRMTAKLHRYGVTLAGHGKAGFCGLYYEPLVDRTAYKFSMTYPVAQTLKFEDRCCQPFGRTQILWGSGKEIPYFGEDFAYMLFRKRNCCKGAF